MRQVFLDKGAVTIAQVSKPLLDERSVLVQVHYSCISSGTESATIATARQSLFNNIPQKLKKVLESITTHGIDATRALIAGKLKGNIQALGYACSGQVLAVGTLVKKLQVGDFVACAGSGYAYHADIVCVPEYLVAKIARQDILKAASVTTLGAIALQGIRRAQISLGESVCVIGLGLLGQLTAQLALRAGCRVFGIDISQERLVLAQNLGVHKIYQAHDAHLINDIMFATEHHGVDVTIITAASKSDTIVQQAMEITRKKGKVVVVGDVGLALQRDPFYKKEIDFLISCSYGPGRYDNAYEQQGQDYPYAYVRWTEQRNMQAFVKLLEQNQINIDSLIGQEVSINEVEKAYERIKTQQELGIVLSYDASSGSKQEVLKPLPHRFIPAISDKIRVGVIGAGGFAKIKLLPLLTQIPDVHIHAVVDLDVANALNVSRQYDARHSLRDEHTLCTQNLVDAVVISSPHSYHTQQALHALQNGKAVFLEKPMSTTYEQFEQLLVFLQQNPHARFCVDYNRAFAPFIQKIKEAVSARSTPLMIYYRMNVGFIPKDHWVQTTVGGGRLIGEACHIVDLFCFLTDSHPCSVSVEVLGISRDDLIPTDNSSTQIRFADGSVCTLLYTAVGNSKMGKERMELFFDGKSIVMDDYTHLRGYGLSRSFDETTTLADKGHETLIKRFFMELRKEVFAPPIAFERLYRVAELTLLIDQLANHGGGEKEL
jgi:predicted dehydrogenase/threonine dehydrogenase-like Zn-dependent dehydrogenase